MKVIFDFDDVIFDARQFKEVIFRSFEKRGYENIRTAYEAVRKQSTPFSLKGFITQATFDSSLENVESMYDEIMSTCPHMLNQQVVLLMKSLGKENCYIVTNGDTEFQLEKIHRSLGHSLVEEIVIVSGTKADEIKKFCHKHQEEEVIFVDDKELFINDLFFEECPNLKTVLFNEHGLENLEAKIEESRKNEMLHGRFSPPSDTEGIPLEETPSHRLEQQRSPFGFH